jgi:hypothetical protein
MTPRWLTNSIVAAVTTIAAHPVVSYAINSYAGASWTECKIY